MDEYEVSYKDKFDYGWYALYCDNYSRIYHQDCRGPFDRLTCSVYECKLIGTLN